jgi:DNA-binding MarR family transcriptional regulator
MAVMDAGAAAAADAPDLPVDDPSGPVLPADLSTDLGWLLGQALHGYLTTTQHLLGDFPGGIRGFHVLRSSAGSGRNCNQLEIARTLGVDRTVMVRIVDDLERVGLVERRPDPCDRRARIVTPTETGLRRLDEASDLLRSAEDHILAPLEDNLRPTFADALRQIVDGLLRIDPDEASRACAAASAMVPDPLSDPLSDLGSGPARQVGRAPRR